MNLFFCFFYSNYHLYCIVVVVASAVVVELIVFEFVVVAAALIVLEFVAVTVVLAIRIQINQQKLFFLLQMLDLTVSNGRYKLRTTIRTCRNEDAESDAIFSYSLSE